MLKIINFVSFHISRYIYNLFGFMGVKKKHIKNLDIKLMCDGFQVGKILKKFGLERFVRIGSDRIELEILFTECV